MLSKSAMLLLGMINEEPKGAYEITKKLEQMSVRWWYKISDATVYSTLHTLEKKEYVTGRIEKNGNMPERTVYTITIEGTEELRKSIKAVFMQMDYDTTVFSIAASYIMIFSEEEIIELLSKRISILKQYKIGIHKKINELEISPIPAPVVDNVLRMEDIVEAEIKGAERIVEKLLYEQKILSNGEEDE